MTATTIMSSINVKPRANRLTLNIKPPDEQQYPIRCARMRYYNRSNSSRHAPRCGGGAGIENPGRPGSNSGPPCEPMTDGMPAIGMTFGSTTTWPTTLLPPGPPDPPPLSGEATSGPPVAPSTTMIAPRRAGRQGSLLVGINEVMIA